MILRDVEVEIEGVKELVKIPDYKTDDSTAVLEKMADYFNPDASQHLRMTDLRKGFTQLVHAIDSHCPNSREKSLAITKLEESKMWANRAIAANEEMSTEHG